MGNQRDPHKNVRERGISKANSSLITMYKDEYIEALRVVIDTGSLRVDALGRRAITVMKKRRHKEWRQLFNEHAKELGYNTAEMRREETISRLQARLEELKTGELYRG